jgi:hypothetical protein
MVVKARLGPYRRRSQTFLLERRNWAEVIVDIALVFDIPPRPFARLGGGISAGVDRDGNGGGFRHGFGGVWLVIFENHRAVCVWVRRLLDMRW